MNTAGKKVRNRGKEKPFLPDEIIRNILIRLPVKSLVRFGVVCRKWRDMNLARDFVDLHQRSSIPVILACKTSLYHLELFAVDKWWDLSRTRSMIHRFPFDFAADFPKASIEHVSHAGLIILRRSDFWVLKPYFVILNPTRPTDECVKINFSRRFRGDICAVYYHPSLKEYCSLWKIHESGHPEPIQYKLLNLGSNPSLKRIRNPFSFRVKNEHAYPLFINDHLYWMLKSEQDYKFGGRNDILEFDIISEEFKVIPCPIPLNTQCKEYQTHLLNSDGVISFILILSSKITIWKLKDHVEPSWEATEYTISVDASCHALEFVSMVAIVDGKLAFKNRGSLFVYNLMEGTVKNFPKKYSSGDVSFLSHQMSLASLKNCTSTLYIDEDGEVVVV